MARRKEHDVQVDPFTAGEPTLPWDEPGVFRGLFDGSKPEACAFGDGPYDGPTKMRDGYDAPSADGGAGDSWRGSSPRPSEARERKRRAREERTSARRAAKDAPKDKRGPSRLGKVVRVIIIFAVLVNLLPVLVFGLGSLFSDLMSETDYTESVEHETPSHDGHAPTSGVDMDSLDEDELACVQICDAYLQAIASEQSPERAAIIGALDQIMVQATGYTCEELGIDANDYADWTLSNFSYQIDSCYAQTDEGTADLYLFAWGPNLTGLHATLRQNVRTYIAGLDVGKEGALRPLTENEQAHVRELFTEALENAEMGSESFLGFQLTFEDGTWVLDLDRAQYQLGFPLGY